MEYLPREDGFPLGFLLPQGTFHQGIPTGMSYLYDVHGMHVNVMQDKVITLVLIK